MIKNKIKRNESKHEKLSTRTLTDREIQEKSHY